MTKLLASPEELATEFMACLADPKLAEKMLRTRSAAQVGITLLSSYMGSPILLLVAERSRGAAVISQAIGRRYGADVLPTITQRQAIESLKRILPKDQPQPDGVLITFESQDRPQTGRATGYQRATFTPYTIIDSSDKLVLLCWQLNMSMAQLINCTYLAIEEFFSPLVEAKKALTRLSRDHQ